MPQLSHKNVSTKIMLLDLVCLILFYIATKLAKIYYKMPPASNNPAIYKETHATTSFVINRY